jgi:hypothetical protein
MKSSYSTFATLKDKIYLLLFLAGLFSSIPAHSNEVHSWIMQGMEPNSITIIGEQHKRAESIQLFQSIISKYLEQDKCLVIALEIASNQQAILDEIVAGKSTVSDIEIPSMIDHPPFRSLINDLAKTARNNDCLKLIAIDAGLEMGIRRDEWMAKILVEQLSQVPILALLGNLHTLKKVEWNFTKASPYVAEILVSLNYRIQTYPQAWLDKTCGTHNQLVPSDRKEATEIINNNLISLLNASEYETVKDVVDGVILWKCS